MSNETEPLTVIKPDEVTFPAGGIALFGRTGSGKSSLLYNSDLLGGVIVADTGSLAHKLYAKGDVYVVDSLAQKSPIDQVLEKVQEYEAKKLPWALDSFSTLQEQQVAWFKRVINGAKGKKISLPDHQIIVGNLRDLALVLAQGNGFTLFNTAPGGKGKTPDGQEIVYPAGCLTGYPALNGTNANSETILARWGNVWGTFTGSAQHGIPRGLYVPGNDIRPESHQTYAPLKDPLFVLVDNTQKGIMAVPVVTDPKSQPVCFLDTLLSTIARKFPKKVAPSPADNFIQKGKK